MGVTDVYMKQWEYSDSKESVLLPKFKKKLQETKLFWSRREKKLKGVFLAILRI